MSKNCFSFIGSEKGLSLPLVTGLVTLLMVASVAANELIFRNIRSARSVESSSRAFFAAEAGIEDGLYELSPHLAGYETPSEARTGQFDTQGKWLSRWGIVSRSGSHSWEGRILKGQKVILPLYTDDNKATVGANAINSSAILDSEIKNLAPSDFSIRFFIPDKDVTDISTIMNNSGQLQIDNDQDGTHNEDPINSITLKCANGSNNLNPADKDCDGKVDEDSEEDPVILWKITDNNGRSLIPIKGCLGDSNAKPFPADGMEKSELCERDFKWFSGGSPKNWSETLDKDAYGLNQDGTHQTVGDFILESQDTVALPNDRMQLELLIVAPMEFVNPSSPTQRIPIPYIGFEVNSSQTDQIPYPYFKVESDGYYGTFKQSISTTVTPKTSVPLFDFTIIQQK